MDKMEQEGKSNNTTLEVYCSTNPLLNPYILATTFNYMKLGNLKICRQICKIWNEEATRVLSTKSCLSLSVVKKTKSSISNFKETIRYLHKLFATSTHPELLLSNAQFNVDVSDRNALMILCHFIQCYGKYFTSLKLLPLGLSVPPNSVKIQDTFLYKALNLWCPNIIHLEIRNGTAWTDRSILSDLELANQISRLKLQSFTIKEQLILPLAFRKSICSVLNGCPNLKSLKVFRDQTDYRIESIFENLLEYPNIAKNVETLTTTLLENDFHQLNFLKEMCNLKKLKMEGIYKVKANEFPISCFSRIKNSLKYLELNNVCYADEDKHGVLAFAEEFPNLEFFKISSTQLPTSRWLRYDDDQYNVAFSASLNILRHNPHKSLKKLLLLNNYNEIWDVEGLSVLIDVFPNLEFLHLDFGYRSEGDWIKNRAKLPDILSILSKQTSLKELIVGTYVECEKELINAIPFIRDFHELQYLTIGLMNSKESSCGAAGRSIRDDPIYNLIKSAPQIVYQWSSLRLSESFANVQNLRYFRLIDFDISTPTTEDVKFLKDKNIKVTFTDWTTLKWERPTWYAGF